MKKISLIATALLLSIFSYGQNHIKNIAENELQHFESSSATSIKKASQKNKALGNIIYSNDFNNPSDWTINNNGQTGSTFGWTIDSTNDGWWNTTGFQSTSGGNFAELSNGNPTNMDQKIGVTYTMTVANPIDLIALGGVGSENCVLEFEQYGARFNDLQEIQISTDGVNFTTVENNLDMAFLPLSELGGYPNPHLKYIDLSSYLNPATAQSLWIRYSWTTAYPGNTNANDWSTYGWYIDDIKIRTKPDNDLRIDESHWGSNQIRYYQIPETQIAPIDFSTNITNTGLNDAKNATLSVGISGDAASTVASAPKDVVAGATDSLFTTYTPTKQGWHKINMEVSSDSLDDTPLNNTVALDSFEIVGPTGIYARDQNSNNPGNNGGANVRVFPPTEDFEAGNTYEIYTTQQLEAIDVFVGSKTKAGAIIDVAIYSINGSFIEIGRSQAYVITASDIENVVSLKLVNRPLLNAGQSYFATVHGWGSNGGNVPEFFYGTSGTSLGPTNHSEATSRIYYPSMSAPIAGENFYTTNTPMVRLNFNPTCNTSSIDNRITCNSLLWIDGNTYTSNNNTATFNIIGGTSTGCDSLVTLNLTISNIATTDSIVTCDSLVWIDGNTYTSNNNNATFNIIGGASTGCDSLVRLNLTIKQIDTIINIVSGTIGANQAGANYKWIDCNSNTIIPNEIAQSFTPPSSGNYAVEITLNGCGIDTSECVNISLCDVSASYSFADNINGNYTFTNNSTGNFNQTHWAFGDGSVSTLTNTTHTFNSNGSFVVVLTINDSLSKSTCSTYFTDTILVNGLTNPSKCNAGFVALPDTNTNNSIIINSATGNNLSYLWSFGDGNTSTLQNPIYTYSSTGPYYICLTIDDGNGCSDMYCDSIGENGVIFNKAGFTISVTSPIVTSLDDQTKLNSIISIYPNPTSNQLTIDTELAINEINIIDITGKLMIATKHNTKSVNVADLSTGIYFLKLITDKGPITKKIVKN